MNWIWISDCCWFIDFIYFKEVMYIRKRTTGGTDIVGLWIEAMLVSIDWYTYVDEFRVTGRLRV